MTLLGGKLTALSCHPTKKVNKAETYLSTNSEKAPIMNISIRLGNGGIFFY
jgi:hypothetical protein